MREMYPTSEKTDRKIILKPKILNPVKPPEEF